MIITPKARASRLEFLCGTTQLAIDYVNRELQEDLLPRQRKYINKVLTELKNKL